MTSYAGISTNTWYTLTNLGSRTYLGIDALNNRALLSTSQARWQFFNTSVQPYGSGPQQWLLRPANLGSAFCLSTAPGTRDAMDLSAQYCGSDTIQWRTPNAVPPTGQQSAALFDADLGYISAACDTCTDLMFSQSIQGFDVAFALSSVAPINDPTWSTLPYSVGGAAASSTVYQTPSVTTTMGTSYVPGSSHAGSTTVPGISTSLPASSNPTTSLAASPVTTNNASPSTSLAPGSFSVSIIDKSIADLGFPAALLLPPHTNVGCRECVASGSIGYANSPIDTSLGTDAAVAKFLDSGFVDMSITNFASDIALDVQLLPGFTVAKTFFSLYNKTLPSLSITNELTFQFFIEIGIPLAITLDTPVIFTGGFNLSIAQANIHLNVSHIESSTATGFDSTSFALQPFRVSAPDLAFSATSGLTLKIHANATAGSKNVGTSGALLFEVDLPALNLTAQIDDNVNDNCVSASSGTVHKHAIGLTLSSGANITASGSLSLSALGHNKTLSSTEFGSHYFPYKNAFQCLYDDRLKAGFLDAGVVSGSNSSSTKSSSSSNIYAPNPIYILIAVCSTFWLCITHVV